MANIGTLELNLLDAGGKPPLEPDCTIEFSRIDGVSILRADHLQFPPLHAFNLPAFPQAQNLHGVIIPSLYRIVQSEFFTLEDASVKNVTATLLRDPAKWSPKFTPWKILPAAFDALKQTIAGHFLKLKHGPDIGVVDANVYDALSSQALLLAKMALLNLSQVTSQAIDPVSRKPWFSFVKQILVIDRERFVAIVDSDAFESVDHIAKNMDSFAKDGFFPGDVSQHFDNIPSDYPITGPLISVKCRYEEGNVQYTTGRATHQGSNCFLLDCDMDEHSNILEHATDFFKHQFTGGTHPIDIHEYIEHHNPDMNLGYDLFPV